MYNPQLETFLRVADAGSFNKAAEVLWQNHLQIHIVDFDFYGMDVFNRCENTNDVLLAVPGWANVHPLLKVLPMKWDHCIPYGILHSPNPTPTVQHFLDVAKAVSKELYGS